LVQAKQRLEPAALFQFTYMGAPMTSHGDEVAINSPSQAAARTDQLATCTRGRPYPWLDQAGDPTIDGPLDTSLEPHYTKLAYYGSVFGAPQWMVHDAADR
jgi:hypothetical protein